MVDLSRLSAAIRSGLAARHETFLIVAGGEESGVVQAVIVREDDPEDSDGNAPWYSVSVMAANPADEDGHEMAFSQETLEALLALDHVRFGLAPATLPDEIERARVNRLRLSKPTPAWGVLLEGARMDLDDPPPEIVERIGRGLVSVDLILRDEVPATYKIISW